MGRSRVSALRCDWVRSAFSAPARGPGRTVAQRFRAGRTARCTAVPPPDLDALPRACTCEPSHPRVRTCLRCKERVAGAEETRQCRVRFDSTRSAGRELQRPLRPTARTHEHRLPRSVQQQLIRALHQRVLTCLRPQDDELSSTLKHLAAAAFVRPASFLRPQRRTAPAPTAWSQTDKHTGYLHRAVSPPGRASRASAHQRREVSAPPRQLCLAFLSRRRHSKRARTDEADCLQTLDGSILLRPLRLAAPRAPNPRLVREQVPAATRRHRPRKSFS